MDYTLKQPQVTLDSFCHGKGNKNHFYQKTCGVSFCSLLDEHAHCMLPSKIFSANNCELRVVLISKHLRHKVSSFIPVFYISQVEQDSCPKMKILTSCIFRHCVCKWTRTFMGGEGGVEGLIKVQWGAVCISNNWLQLSLLFSLNPFHPS